jgi:hypothetical protein
VADQGDRPVLRVDDLARGFGVAREGQRWVLDDPDVVAVLLQEVVRGLPPRPIHESAVDEHDVVDS